MRLGRLFRRRGVGGPSRAAAPAPAAGSAAGAETPKPAAAPAPESEISPSRLDAALGRLREQIPAPADERQQTPEG